MNVVFTPKELEILAWVVAGESNKEIGKHVGHTEYTTKNKMRAIYDKTGMSTRLELALWVMAYIHQDDRLAELRSEK